VSKLFSILVGVEAGSAKSEYGLIKLLLISEIACAVVKVDVVVDR
jgi:hypothetical protein